MADRVPFYVRTREELDRVRNDLAYELGTGRRVNVFVRCAEGAVSLAFSAFPVHNGYMLIEESGRQTGIKASFEHVIACGKDCIRAIRSRDG